MSVPSQLKFNWNNIGGPFSIILSTDNFTTLNSSLTISATFYNYTGLVPNTQYWFQVKISTEFFYNNPISQFTSPSSSYDPNILNPFFSAVGHDFINVDWFNNPGSSYVTQLSTDPAFTLLYSSGFTPNNFKDYFGLASDATYYFRVRVSTDPSNNFSIPISTKTKDLVSLGDYALNFTGTNSQMVRTPSFNSLNLGGNHTIEFWFRRNVVNGIIQHLVSKDPNSFNSGWGIVLQPSGFIRYETFGVGGGLTSSFAITDTDWHHFALTKTASANTIMYIDGAQVASGVTNTPIVNSFDLKIGANNNGGDVFNGKIDEFRFWDSVRDNATINAARYIHLVGNESSLFIYYDFDDGSGQIVSDLSPSPINGQLGLTGSPETSDPAWVIDPIPGFGGGPDTDPPTVFIESIADGSTQTVTTLDFIEGTADDNAQLEDVEFYLLRESDYYYWRFDNGFANGSGNWAPAVAWNQANGLNDWHIIGSDIFWATGTYTLYVEAEDKDFNIAVSSVQFDVQIATETIPPTVYISYPVHGSTYTANQLSLLSGTAADETALANVGMRIVRHSDNFEWDAPSLTWINNFMTINDSNGLESWQFNMPNSAWTVDSDYSFYAGAQDAAANVTFATVTFHLQISTNSASDSGSTASFHKSSGFSNCPCAHRP